MPGDTSHTLGRISLRWMVRECFRMNTGIQFQAEKPRCIGLDPASLYPEVKERPRPLQPHNSHLTTVAPPVPMASEEEHDVRDALAPMHDQLAVYSPLWCVMQFYPLWRPLRVPIGPPSEWQEGSEITVRQGRNYVSGRLNAPHTYAHRIPLPRSLFVPKQHSRLYVHPSVYTRQ